MHNINMMTVSTLYTSAFNEIILCNTCVIPYVPEMPLVDIHISNESFADSLLDLCSNDNFL